MFSSSKIEKALALEVEWLRRQLEKKDERIDRLTEALAKIAEVPLVMPQTPEPLTTHVRRAAQAQVIEKSSGWFDTKPAPVTQNSGGNHK